MKEIYEKMLLISVICLALGNSLPIHCPPNEKKEEGEDNEISVQVNKKIINSNCKGLVGNKQMVKTRYHVVIIPGAKKDRYETDTEVLKTYFGTKEKSKSSLLFVAKCFVIFYILIGFAVRRDGEVPEVLFIVGLLSLGLKFLL
ncbi:uncharacterized protein LOC135130633 [Zophobas morio]|uniref:uncharacterized protein LOC135130633 n=1 Tax=Zophobas morio TaxID=2755281 RepID=UPI0030831719